MQEEIWKDIIIEKNGVIYDFTGLYQVSNLGRVRALKYRRSNQIKILKTTPNNKGYKLAVLSKNGKQTSFLVHRLVATMFIPNPNNLPVVNHLDENPSNCNVENLEWCTVRYNSQYSSYKKKGKTFTEEHKQKIRENHNDTSGCNNGRAKRVLCVETGKIFECIKYAQEWLGKGHIYSCLTGKAKTAGGYHWQYVD